MNKFISVIWEAGDISEDSLVESVSSIPDIPLNENAVEYIFGETAQGAKLFRMSVSKTFSESDCDIIAGQLAEKIFNLGIRDFDLEFTAEGEETDEETYEGNDFFEEYGILWYNEDEALDEAEYQGRNVPLGKPMKGDVKKFKVYVKKPNGNVVKVNFGDPDMRIKKSNPARRRSFRARHNCDNPGPRDKARYWSCKKW